MSKPFSLLIVIISSLITVVLTQIDYDYDYGRHSRYPDYGRQDYYREPYLSYHRRAVANYGGDDPKARNIVDKFKGLFTGAACLLNCLVKFSKDCGGLIECGWKCMSSEPLPEPDKLEEEAFDDPQLDKTEMAEGGAPAKGGVLPPGDVVRITACSVQCLTKYLPRSKASLQRFMTCIVIRCFCDKKVNRSSG